MFSVRFVTADSYQAKPIPQLDPTFSEFRGSEIKHVPVIRIFGITATGEKTCLHVHGVFPYLFVPYTGEEDPGILSYRLAASLDAAINISLGSATSNTQHVYAIQRVSGTPFYGYHRKEHQFLKIYFYSPAMIKRAADLLQNGSVLNQSLQPHEAHINYILQFMMDYNIYGMSMINLRCVKHRRLMESLGDLASSGQSVNSESSDIVYMPSDIERQSTCELEIDAIAQDILNRLEIDKDLELNPGLAAIWNEERARRAQAGLQVGDSQLVNPKSPPRPIFNPTENDIYQEQRLARRLQMISQCDESTLSSTSNRSVAYAAEVRDGENLLTSSHVGNITPTIEKIPPIAKEEFLGNVSFLDSSLMPASQKTPDCSILGTEDMPLVDLLDQLARDSEEKLESVDTDSVLGSQVHPLLNDEKSDNEEDDTADLNLTSLQLDSLSSLEIAENSNKRSEVMKKYSKDEDLTSILHVSPFTSSYEISCSPKSLRGEKNVDGERKEESSRDCRVPQYDGAGDVSPTLMNSDNEDVQYRTTNAKDFSHLSELNGTCGITSESRKSDKIRKISNRTNITKTNNNVLDIGKTQERPKSNENVCNPQERPCIKAQPAGASSSTTTTTTTTTSDNYLVQYPGTSYGPYDRLLEIGTEFVPDLDVMHSSMDMGILLSSEDTEKVESTVEIVEEEIPLEAVLNGDPCFTESAELDKSDLTELHDQYVSLFGNVPLPEVSMNRRNETDNTGNTSNFTDNDTNLDENNGKIVTTSHSPQASSVSQDSSSSSENIEPNIQEPETRGSPTSKSSNENEAQICTETSGSTNDNSDYNCNVVATWAELQNLQIVDKSKIQVRTNSSRRGGRCQSGLSTMTRRGIRLASTEQVAASQVLRNSSEKISFQVSNSCPSTPSKIEKNSLRATTKRLSLSISTDKEKFETRRKSSDGLLENLEERLSCGLLSHIPRLSTSLIETGSEREFQPLRTAASLDAFHRSIIGSDNPLADIRTTLPGVKYSSYPLNESENVNTPILADIDESAPSSNRLEEFPESQEETVRGVSHYSSDRSHNSPTIDIRGHRHCSMSRHKKIVEDDVFTSDDIWIIEKRKRGKPPLVAVRHPSPCSGAMCRLPVIRLKKIQQGTEELIDVTTRTEEENVTTRIEEENVTTITEEENVTTITEEENVTTRTEEEKVQFPEKHESPIRRKSRGRRKLAETCSSLEDDTNNSSLDKTVKDPNIPVLRSWSKNVGRQAHRFLTNEDVTTRDSYNMRRHPSIVKFPKQLRRRNAKSMSAPEDSRSLKREIKKPRARTKYKEDNLPGIPGITNPEPVKRQRAKKIVDSSPNGSSPDGSSAKSTGPKKILPSKLFPNWGAERETPKSQTYAIIDKLPGNGLVLETRKVSTTTPEKRKGRTIKHPLQISPVPKRNNRGGTENSCKKHLNFSSTTPETVVKKRQSLIDRMKATSNEEQLSEAITLSLMMREAKSRGTRAKLRMILEKRLSDQACYIGKKKTPSEKTIVTPETNPTVPEISITPDITENTEKVEKESTTVADESQVNNIEVVEANSLETVAHTIEITTVADTKETTIDNSDEKEKCDSTTVALDVPEVPNPPEYDNSTLSTDFCSSVDEETTDMFDAEPTVDSVIVETTNVEELAGETKQLAYDTDRYENAIKEANFFAGKNYTIDAVSLEIPTCLFEEDSNSVDKRMPKKGYVQLNYEDYCNTTEDDSSELSIDPRDLDVYDVESLTPSSSLCALNDSIDNNESIFESSETEDLTIGENPENRETDCARKFVHAKISTNIVDEQETVSELESSFEEESPAFETLSPKPRICHLVSKALQEEFTVHSTVEDLENTRVCQKTIVTITPNEKSCADREIPKITPTEKISTVSDVLSIAIEDPRDEIPFDDKNDLDDSAVDNEIKNLVAKAINDFENEQELSDMCANDDEPISIIDMEIQLRSNVEKTVNGVVQKEGSSLSAKNELELSIASGTERRETAIIENDGKPLESNEKQLESEISSKTEKDSTGFSQKAMRMDIDESEEFSKIAGKHTTLPIVSEKDQVSCLNVESGIQRPIIPTEDKGVQTPMRTDEWLSIRMRREKEVENIVSEDKTEPEVVRKIIEESIVDIQAQQDESGVFVERRESDEPKGRTECQPEESQELEISKESESEESQELEISKQSESEESQEPEFSKESELAESHEAKDQMECQPEESQEPEVSKEFESEESQAPEVSKESELTECQEPEVSKECEPEESQEPGVSKECEPEESQKSQDSKECEPAESHEPEDQMECQPEESQEPAVSKESEREELQEPEVSKECQPTESHEAKDQMECQSEESQEPEVSKESESEENQQPEVSKESESEESQEPEVSKESERKEREEAEVSKECEPVESREAEAQMECQSEESHEPEVSKECESEESQEPEVSKECEPAESHEAEAQMECQPEETQEPEVSKESEAEESQEPKVSKESEPSENHEPEGQTEYQPGEIQEEAEVPKESGPAESEEPEVRTESEKGEHHEPKVQLESTVNHELEVQPEFKMTKNHESSVQLETTGNHESDVSSQSKTTEDYEPEVSSESQTTEHHEPEVQLEITENRESEVQSEFKTTEDHESTIQLKTTEDHESKVPIESDSTRSLVPEDDLERPQIESHKSEVPMDFECTNSHDRKTDIQSECIESHEPPKVRIESECAETDEHETPVESECTESHDSEVPIQLECTENHQQKFRTESETEERKVPEVPIEPEPEEIDQSDVRTKSNPVASYQSEVPIEFESVESHQSEVPIENQPAESHQTEVRLESESAEKLEIRVEPESTKNQESESREQEIKSKVIDEEIKSNDRSIESSEEASRPIESSKEMEMVNVTADRSSETPSKGVECRPVSIKLLNIDLSKIRNFGPKNRSKIRSKVKQQLSSKTNEADNKDEKSLEKVTPSSESLEDVEVNTEKLGSLENLETDLRDKNKKDNEKKEATESKTTVPNNRQKTSRKMLKVRRMPERRSVRIYAEMTKNESKLSHQESATKFIEDSESTRDESTPETVTNIIAGTDSLIQNTKEKAVEERESSQVARTLLDENSRKITDEVTTTESFEKSGNITQELVLSEQKISCENSTRSSIKPRRRGSGKSSQTNSQEVTSSQQITDENTAPTFIRSKRGSGSRKNSQSNVQESFVESKSAKSTTEDSEPKITDKTSLTDKASIEIQPAELESRFTETNVETKNSILQPQTSLPKITESASLQSTLPLPTIANEFLPPPAERLVEILYQEMHSPIAFSLLAREIEEAKSTVDAVDVADKGDRTLWEKSSRTKKRVEEITEEASCANNILEKRTVGKRTKPKCLVKRKRGRPRKHPRRRTATSVLHLSPNEVPDGIPEAPTGSVSSSENKSEENNNPNICVVRRRRRCRGRGRRIHGMKRVFPSSKRILSPKQISDETVKALETPKSTQGIAEGNIEPNTSITHKRKGRFGNGPMLIRSDSLPDCESITEKTVERIASQEPELSPEKICEKDTAPKTSIVLKRITRSGKSPEDKSDSVSQESNSSVETTMNVSVESSSPVMPKRRCRPAKSLEKENPQGIILKEKYSQGSQLRLREIPDENNVESNIRVVRKLRRRFVIRSRVRSRKSSKQIAQPIEEEKPREPESIPRRIAEENSEHQIFIELDRFVHKQETNANESSRKEISKCFSEHETLPQKIAEENVEPKKSVAPKRRGRSGRISETKASMVLTQETMTKENKSEDKQIDSTTQQTAEIMKNVCEDNISTELEILPKELPEKDKPKTLLRPKKRVRFDEESIRRFQQYRRENESSSSEDYEEPVHRKHYQLTLVKQFPNSPTNQHPTNENKTNDAAKTIDTEDSDSTESLDLDTRWCLFMSQKILKHQKQNVIATKGKNGVTEKATFALDPDDEVFLNLSSLQDSEEKRRPSNCEPKQKILKKPSKSVKNERCTHVDEKLKIKNPCSVKKRRRRPLVHAKWFLHHDPKSVAAVQLQEPKIVLKRLSQDTLKSHGIAYKPKKKKFVKLCRKSIANVNDDHVEADEEFLVPAYDGAADLSSSDSSTEDPDVTIAREEKRVCVYKSTKKSENSKRDAIVTPKKRKLDFDAHEASSPSTKRVALATGANEVPKTPYRSSSSRTSMLKSPGRMSGNYSPLKIIVTSPKVRRETIEPRLSTQVTNSDDNAKASSSTASCVTTPRRNKSRLHDCMLRGRFSNRKPTIRELGDKHGPVATTRSDGLGELDGIQSSGQRENRIVENVDSMMVSSEPTRIHSSSTTKFGDDKAVRKKLEFLWKDDKSREITNETAVQVSKASDSTILTDNDSFKLIMSDEQSEQSARIDENNERTEISKICPNAEAMMFDAEPGPSRVCTTMDCENRGPYEITTDEDSDDDDVCDVTFTQYVDSQITTQDPTSLSARDETTDESNKHITIMPKFNPPSRQRIIDTMHTYGIPTFRNQEPFFSNPADVPKQKELAHKMLKVPSKSINDLPAFVPSVEGVTGLARWRKMMVNEFYPHLAKTKDLNVKLALAGNERIVITPLVQPPTQKEARDWLRARKYLEMKKKKEEEELKKNFEETAKIEIHGRAADTEEKHECSSNTSDSTSVEPSPDRTLVSDESDKMLTLEVKLANRDLTQKAKNLAENTIDLQRSNTSRGQTSERRDTGSSDMDASLLSVLKKSRLFRDEEASRHLGVSCGQIEFLSDSTRSNVANENLRNVKALTRYQYLTIMCLEVFVITRGDLLPDSLHDPIAAIFFSVQSDVPPTSNIKPLEHGVIVVADTEKSSNKMYYANASNVPWTISFARSEEALLNSLVNLITRVDPEILIGWELETLSWGYVFQRASRLGMNLSKRVSRIPATQCKWEAPAPDIETLAEVKLPGRIVLDIWRLMRHEAALLSYTFESMMHHVLNERISCPSFKILTEWWNLEKSRPSRWRVVEHYGIRVLGVFRLLDQLDIIGRTSELARLFGIQFFEVFSRGSQFRVESVMLRLAKPMNYIAVSPSPLQRASMRAMEALPLIMEPESMFYSDPLIVLDFQSLYPSIIIAHNYCFSTCLGRIEHIGQPQPFEFGAYTLRVPKSTAMKLQSKVNYAPCGVAYVKPEVRLGILPRMLTEILETRFMVKKAMKDHNKDDKTLQRALHSRQMGLKFLANVTYGYTAANFSGRMPCIEVGDSVISKSKETLERAIKLVETTPKWGARVVYGDTDSLFILVPGKSKADAFIIGNEIADAVTASNPPPIKLKFEKVMYPAILQTKKRYCGYMYETPEQETPTYLAKGIETVRRDGCPAVSKMLEKTLKILFETKDVSLVKKYVTRQLDKILRGKVSIQDLTFAKEFRGLMGYKARACVPALELTRRLMRKDPRAVPRNSERVRYVIVAGAPNQALIHCVRTPWELINDPGLRPNAIYYITRVIIPPLNRCLNLMGVDAHAWYREMPHRHILDNPTDQPPDKQKLTIFQYFGTIVCVSCGQSSNKGICMECLANPADTLVVIHEKLRWLDRTNSNVTAICQSCVGQADTADCSSLDCPVLYRRAQSRRELAQANHLREIIECGNNLEF